MNNLHVSLNKRLVSHPKQEVRTLNLCIIVSRSIQRQSCGSDIFPRILKYRVIFSHGSVQFRAFFFRKEKPDNALFKKRKLQKTVKVFMFHDFYMDPIYQIKHFQLQTALCKQMQFQEFIHNVSFCNLYNSFSFHYQNFVVLIKSEDSDKIN